MKLSVLNWAWFALVLLALQLNACGTAQQAEDTDADIAAIKSLSEQAQDAYIARDWERFASFFTDDGVWMPPNKAPLVGKEAWWSWVQQWWDQSAVEQMNVSHEEIVVAGNWAFVRHNESQVTIPVAGGEPRQSYFKGIWRQLVNWQTHFWESAKHKRS
jgi:uncharacterized protein (TIGR02246 family)